MTQEQKELLLKDLCARSFYGVMCDRLGQAKKLLSVSPDKLYCIELDNGEYTPSKYKVEDVKPYLRPMDSMTEKEKEELFEAINKDMNLLEETLDKEPLFTYRSSRYMGNPIHYELDFLISHHFDYLGLIPMGLALPAKEGMYNKMEE